MLMAKYLVTYANGDKEIISHQGSSSELFQQLFSSCSEEVQSKCKVEKLKTEKPKDT